MKSRAAKMANALQRRFQDMTSYRAPPPILRLRQLPTLRRLYAEGDLQPKQSDDMEESQEVPEHSLLDKVSLLKYDITRVQVDAIVNAANKSLLGGGGVDGAIHRAAGGDLVRECRKLRGCETGEAKITKGHRLPAPYIIHTVGPIYDEGPVEQVSEELRLCYYNSLKLAVDNELKSVAFCSISTGVYGYPVDDATHIALQTTKEFLEGEDGDKLDRVIFITFSDTDTEVYKELIPEYFPLDNSVAPPSQTESLSPEALIPLPDSPMKVDAKPLDTSAPESQVTETVDEAVTTDPLLVASTEETETQPVSHAEVEARLESPMKVEAKVSEESQTEERAETSSAVDPPNETVDPTPQGESAVVDTPTPAPEAKTPAPDEATKDKATATEETEETAKTS